jgi:ribosomal protein S18 acetylase RimI-like enzyme
VDDVRIRRAGVSDRAGVLLLIEDFYAVDGHAFDLRRVTAGLDPLLRDDDRGQVWVAVADEQPVGYAVVCWGWSLEAGGRECLLDELYVARRGVGLGAALLRHVMAAAAQAGATVMVLETEAHNDAARRFYLRHGFAAERSQWFSRAL